MINKYVVLSTDNNSDYYNLLPLVCYSWIKLDYTPLIIQVLNLDSELKYNPAFYNQIKEAVVQPIESIKGIKDSTTAQISRLFASTLQYIDDNDILVTADADMVMGRFNFIESEKIISYGFDLTGYSEIPMCYVSGTKQQWIELMQLKNSSGDLNTEIKKALPEKSFSDKWEDFWSVDQQLLTQRAKEYGFENILFVNRGNDANNHGLPIGRWDRHKWENIPFEIIDVHMKRNDLEAQIKVFETLWPNDDIRWLKEFHEQLKK